MVNSKPKSKSNRYDRPIQKLVFLKPKSERTGKLKKPAADDLLSGLKKKGVAAQEVEILRKADLSSLNELMTFCEKNPKLKGITELRLHEIYKAALQAGKVRHVYRKLKKTAFAKKQIFVTVRNIPKGITDERLFRHFGLISGVKRAEIRPGQDYRCVYFVSKEDAARAARVMNESQIGKNIISVKVDGEPK